VVHPAERLFFVDHLHSRHPELALELQESRCRRPLADLGFDEQLRLAALGDEEVNLLFILVPNEVETEGAAGRDEDARAVAAGTRARVAGSAQALSRRRWPGSARRAPLAARTTGAETVRGDPRAWKPLSCCRVADHDATRIELERPDRGACEA